MDSGICLVLFVMANLVLSPIDIKAMMRAGNELSWIKSMGDRYETKFSDRFFDDRRSQF